MKKILLFVSLLLVSCAENDKEAKRQDINPISHKTLSNNDALFLKNLKDNNSSKKYYSELSKDEKQQVKNIFRNYINNNKEFIRNNFLQIFSSMIDPEYKGIDNKYNFPHKDMKKLQKSIALLPKFLETVKMAKENTKLEKLKQSAKYSELQALLPFTYDLSSFNKDDHEEEKKLIAVIDKALYANNAIETLKILGYESIAQKINLSMNKEEINQIQINNKQTVKNVIDELDKSFEVVNNFCIQSK